MPYPRLFSPLQIGPVESRNRIVFGAHFTMFSEPSRTWGEPGFHGERLGRYVADRAQGGAGVIIVGQTQVHPSTAYQMTNNAAAWDEAAIPHFTRVTEPVHRQGALAFIQLAHNGGVNFGAWSKLPVLSPSHVVNSTEAPKMLERHEITELVEYFARSARNAAAGGFDGIEIHAAHGYLIHEFLSPRSNQRTDEYGGSVENRTRFAVEVLRAVRDAVGPKIAVGLRLVGDEELSYEQGLTADDAADLAARFAALGVVDFLNVSVGLSGLGMVRPMYAPHLLGVYAAHKVKQAVPRVPVFAVHRILLPDEAEGILERGEADAVTLVRALIADPEWPNKARAGAAQTIRRCTGSNQGCYGNLTQSLPITCVTNPAVGRDAEFGLGTLRPATQPKRVVVIGGGPGGLEAAWVAAARGHRVTLLERSAQLGGKIRLAQKLPGRAELADFADWRVGECERRGVDIQLNTNATAESVLALKADAVVVATGGRATKLGTSKFFPMPVAGSEQDFVIDHEQALLAADTLGDRIIIFDAVGHIEAIGLGELLASRGANVTVVTTLPMPINLDRETMGYALPRAVRAGMRWRPNTALGMIGDHAVTLVDTLSRQLEQIERVDTVVIRTNGLPNDELYFALKDQVPEVIRIGDAVAVRLADRAIFDGHMAGRTL
ncbi:MAG: FAD-dependent oxidoreductase [Deltaproteobacteria bacterium]|nr:FAD-dependent oxidoreductase [Deltaproteobacteria bacterium]MBI3388539.1 FAD-dependent oxidoreductase [Deltaproteobacteria bacterium]